jgi:transcriptional regulator with XRE-family HTH domain
MNKAVGKVIKRLREERGLSQESLGFQTTLHRTYISQLERGLKSPTLNTLNVIAKVLHISMTEFMRLVEEEISHEP